MDPGIADSVAIVTGGAGRLGRAICAALAREGARVGLVDRAPNVGDVARQFGAARGARGVQCDIADRASVARMLDEVTDALGPVDVLVNAHGIYPNVPLLEMDDAEWDEVFA